MAKLKHQNLSTANKNGNFTCDLIQLGANKQRFPESALACPLYMQLVHVYENQQTALPTWV